MNQPARRKTDADATGTNQLDVTHIFCGKLLFCPASKFAGRGTGRKTWKREVLLPLHSQPAQPHGGAAESVNSGGARTSADFVE
jgi:hypothetical protein